MRIVLASALLTLGLLGQTQTVPVTFAWALDETHTGSVAWEIQANSAFVTCGDVRVTETDRRCTAFIEPGDYTFRLRGTAGTVVGDWSEPLIATVAPSAPGPMTLTAHFEEPTGPIMAFPQVAATSGGAADGATITAHSITLPSGIQAGDLMLVMIGVRQSTIASWSVGWTPFNFSDTGNATIRIGAGYRIATADANDALTVTTNNATRVAYNVYRIQTGTHDAATAPAFSEPEEATTSTPNPPNLTPGGGEKDFLWLAFSTWVSEVTVSTTPASYTDSITHTNTDTSSNRMTATSVRRALNASSEDPGIFQKSGGSASLTITVGIHPSVGGAFQAAWTRGSNIIIQPGR